MNDHATPGSEDAVPRLWDDWSEVVRRIAVADRLLACFDYDGTLSGIREDPEEVTTRPEIADALERLAGCPGTEVAVVSGRPLEEVAARTPESLWLVGHHGQSIRVPEGKGEPRSRASTIEASRTPLDPLRRLAERYVSCVEGVWLEEKGGEMIALHTRGASPEASTAVSRYFVAAARGCRGFRVIEGNEVVEVLPEGTSKAAGLETLCVTLAETVGAEPSDTLVLYVGDDTTDEDVFEALRDDANALTVHVGADPETAARFRVGSVDEVAELLERLVQVRSRSRRSERRDSEPGTRLPGVPPSARDEARDRPR